MLDIRNLNQGIDRRREEIFDEYFEAKYANFRFKGFEDYERLKNQPRTFQYTIEIHT